MSRSPRTRTVLVAVTTLVVATVGATTLVGAPTATRAASGTPGAAAELAMLTIPAIQGRHHLSPYAGTVVTTTGVVTATASDAYWVQDPRGDGDDSTSDALYVYTGSDGTKPPTGSTVTVTGTVREFRPGPRSGPNLSVTELTDATWTESDRRLPVPRPVVVGPGGREAPAQTVDAVGGRTDIELPDTEFRPERDALDFYETLEGMLVEVRDAEVVGPTNDYGELTVVPGGTTGLPRTTHGGVRYAAYTKPNTRRLTVDDELLDRPLPAVDVGDVLPGRLVGPLTYDFGAWRVHATVVPAVRDNGPRRERTRAPRPDELAIATFNVENLDPSDPDEKFESQAHTIVENLAAPDIVALEEVQDDTGAECPDGPTDTCTPDGVVAADRTLRRLVTAIGDAGGPTYHWRQISPENLADGGQPTGNIRVAFLFRTDRGLTFVDRPGGDATTPTEVIGDRGRARLTYSPGRIAPNHAAWTDSRKPLVGEFRWRGRTVFVVANHFSSKGSDEPLTGRWQPPARPTESQRHAQARVVHDFVADVLDVQPSAAIAVVGDLNDFEFSRTIDLLVGSDHRPTLYDLPRELPGRERYGYVYQGNSQVLDHILLSPGARRWRPSYDIVHVNAEFADQDSDHDPQIVRLAVR